MKWAIVLGVLGLVGCGAVPAPLRSEGSFKGVLTCIQNVEDAFGLVDRNIVARSDRLELDSFGDVTIDGRALPIGDELVQDLEDGVQREFTVTEINGGLTWIRVSYVTSSVGNDLNPFEGAAFEIWTFLSDGSVEHEYKVFEIINNANGRPIGSSDIDCTGILERE